MRPKPVITRAGAMLLAAVFVALALHGFAADSKLSPNERHFIAEATEDALGEIELAKLALQNAAAGEVKQLAQRLIDDHAKALQELEAIATKLGAPAPREPGGRQKGELKKLSPLTGEKFDREFADQMIRDHEKAVALYEKQAMRADSDELKGFAARMLPVLQEHLKIARSVSGKK